MKLLVWTTAGVFLGWFPAAPVEPGVVHVGMGV